MKVIDYRKFPLIFRCLPAISIACILSCPVATAVSADEDKSFGILKGKVVPAHVGTMMSVTPNIMPAQGQTGHKVVHLTESGEFEITLPQGLYTVFVGHKDYVLLHLRDVNLQPGKVTDLGNLALKQAGTIAGRILSDDPNDWIIVYAFRRLDTGGWDRGRDGLNVGVGIIDSTTGLYEINQVDPDGIYDLSIASAKHGIRCFVESRGPVYSAEAPLSRELQAQLNKRKQARLKGDIDGTISILSNKFPTPHVRIKESYRNDAQKRSQAGEELTFGKDQLINCIGGNGHAISVGKSEWRWADKTGRAREHLVEIRIDLWEREDGEWRIVKSTLPPATESRAQDDWVASQSHINQSPPPSFGEPTVIMGDKLVGIRVKAGETTTGMNYTFGKAK